MTRPEVLTHESPEALADRILSDVTTFETRARDDIAILVVAVAADAAAPRGD